MTETKYLLWDVDTTNDFFDAPFEQDGKTYQPGLPAPGSSIIRPALKELVQYAYNNANWRVMGSVDAHTKNDVRHLAKWPRHGIKGTPGQQKITETQLPNSIFVPMQQLPREELAQLIATGRPIYFEKQELPAHPDADTCLSCAVNPNVAPALTIARPDLIVVDGVLLGYCVRDAIEYIHALGYRIAAATDAIKELMPNENALYEKWQEQGILLTRVQTIINGGLERLLQSEVAA